MTHSFRLSGARTVFWLMALAAMPAVAQKQDPADPAAAVPPTRYVSLLAPVVTAPAPAPAENWRALNDLLGRGDAPAEEKP